MRKIICILLVMFSIQTLIIAQCGKNHKEILNKYCKGIYLTHKVVKSDSIAEIRFIFNKGTKYALYLLNPNKDFPTVEILGKMDVPFSSFSTKYYMNENYLEYTFTAKDSGEFLIKADFNKQEDACVLLALYFISH